MAGDNDKIKKGFSGLSDLASKVSGIDEPIKPEPKAEAKPATPKQPPQPQRELALPEAKRKATSSPLRIETVSSGKSGGGSGGKWIIGIIGVVFVIWLINSSSPQRSSYSKPSSAPQSELPDLYPEGFEPVDQEPNSSKDSGLQYTKPSTGTNNMLSVPEIRWCIRESIRIEAMRDVIDTNAGIDEFNRIVNDYNSRCGSYRYRKGSQSQAKREVEAYQSQIISEAIREARQLGSRSFPSVLPGASSSSVPKKPNAQQTREAQQLLTDLGYEPGPADGDYGRRTAEAVKAFQRDAGITQDGWIDEEFVFALRLVKAKATYKPPVSQPKPQSQTSSQLRSSPPPTATTTSPQNRSYEEQFKYDAAQRLRRLGYDVDWRTSSLTEMIDAESRIGTANRLAQLGYDVDWRKSSLTEMIDAESRIGTANRLKQKGISVDWRSYSLTQLLNMEYGNN